MSRFLDALLAQRAKPPYSLRFSTQLEEEFRRDLSKLLRITRTTLFCVLALAFALAPFQEVTLFHAPVELRGSLLLFAQTVAPLAMIGAALTWLRAAPVLTQGVQAATVVGVLVAMLALRYFSLISEFRYPAGMLGLAGIAIAVFGGFSWRPMMVGLTAYFGFAIAQEFTWTHSNSAVEAYQLGFAFAIAALGSFTNEVLRRQNWLQKECATALARVDVLTTLSNRSDFELRMAVTMRQARRDGRTLGVMVLDVDHFKSINDRFGHAVGDEALRAVAAAIDASCAQRPLDIKARTGGEEFVVVWYDVSPATLPQLAERVLDTLRAIHVPVEGKAEPLSMTASAGVCWAVPTDETTAEALVGRADALMYQAKQAGRDRLVVEPYTPESGSPV